MRGDLLALNASFAALLGGRPDDIRGRNLREFAESPGALAQILTACLGATDALEFRDCNNFERFLSLCIAARNDDEASLVTAVDLSDMRGEQHDLLESRQRFLDMATAGSDALHEINLEPGAIRGVVHIVTARRIDGELSLREFDRIWPDEIVDETYDPAGLADYYELIRAGKPYKNVVYRTKRDDDEERYVRVSATPFVADDGVGRGYRGLGVDITAQVVAERALHESQEKLARSEQHLNWAQRVAAVGSAECDLRSGARVWSEGMYRLYGVEPGSFEASNANTLSMIHPADREGMAKALDAFTKGAATAPGQFRILRPDGSVRTLYVEVDVVRDETGAPIRSVATVKDITELTERIAELEEARDHLQHQRTQLLTAREEADRANEAKSRFLAHMSHEIRTPLNGVLGMAQAMAADELPAVQRERLNTVTESGRALLSILNDILDVAKIEAGKLELETIEFAFEEVVKGGGQVFESAAERKGVGLAFDIDAAHGVYRGDPTRLRQIIANLVSNALKFTDEGAVSVKANRTDGGVVIEVRDSGIGMDEETLGRLFGQFAQAGASTTRRFGGTGLGLSICRQLAEMMGGSISVTSAPGVGSTFTVSLPLAYVGEAQAPCAAQDAPANSEALSSLRILAAEDNKTNQLVLKTLLGQIGIEVTMVDNGLEAVDAWKREAWDLILMDIEMPGMTGVEATRAIRRQEVATGRTRTPIIVLSANAMSHQLAEYGESGADGHVAKPIETALLFEALGAALAEAEPDPQPARQLA